MVDLTAPAATIRWLATAPRDAADRAIAELTAAPGSAPSGTQLLLRSAARARVYELSGDPKDLAAALADFDASPVFGRDRDAVARRLVVAQLHAVLRGQPVDLGRINRALDMPDDPDAPGTLDALRGLALGAGALIGEPGYDLEAAQREADRITVPAGTDLDAIVPAFRQALLACRSRAANNAIDAETVAAEVRNLRRTADPNNVQWLRTELMRLGSEAMAAAQRNDIPAAMGLLPQIKDVVDQLPLDDPVAAQLRTVMDQAGVLAGGPSDVLRRDAQRSDLQTFLLGMSECAQATDRHDVALLASGVAHIREAVDLCAPNNPQRCAYVAALGQMQTQLFQLRRQPGLLPEAIRHLETAVQLAGSAAHPLWSSSAKQLAVAYRLAGRLADGRQWGRRALRGNTWTVLLQEGRDNARASARHAVAEAVEVARWCIADGEVSDAATALDAGCGLFVTALRVTAGVAERLTAAGRAELAEQWRHQGGQDNPAVGGDLRRQAVLALTNGDAHGALDPPSLDEVRAALTALGADALVYLVPADEHGPGLAVLVPRAEAPYHLPLPDGLSSATGRLVLVPMGATVPPSHALVSYTPSARLLCDSAWHPSSTVPPELADPTAWSAFTNP